MPVNINCDILSVRYQCCRTLELLPSGALNWDGKHEVRTMPNGAGWKTSSSFSPVAIFFRGSFFAIEDYRLNEIGGRTR